MADYNLSLPAETIDQDLLWLDDKKDEIIKQTDLLSGTGQSTTATMTQKAITDAINAGYLYKGIATPATNPGTPDANVFYLASEAGTYTNFGGIVINEGEVCALVWNGTWTKQVTGAATADKLNQLGQEINQLVLPIQTQKTQIETTIELDGKYIQYPNSNTGAYGPEAITAPITLNKNESLDIFCSQTETSYVIAKKIGDSQYIGLVRGIEESWTSPIHYIYTAESDNEQIVICYNKRKELSVLKISSRTIEELQNNEESTRNISLYNYAIQSHIIVTDPQKLSIIKSIVDSIRIYPIDINSSIDQYNIQLEYVGFHDADEPQYANDLIVQIRLISPGSTFILLSNNFAMDFWEKGKIIRKTATINEIPIMIEITLSNEDITTFPITLVHQKIVPLRDNYSLPQKTLVIPSKNLMDYNNVVDGWMVNADGTFEEIGTPWVLVKWVLVKGLSNVVFGMNGVAGINSGIYSYAFYDSNKKYISGVKSYPNPVEVVSVPLGAAYLCFTDKFDYESNKHQVNAGTLIQSYDAYVKPYYITNKDEDGFDWMFSSIRNKRVIHIGNDVGCDFAEIQPAINDIWDDAKVNPYVIIVHPRENAYAPFSMIRKSFEDTYPWVNNIVKNISIIGLDKTKCVIQSNTGDYYNPAAELLTNGTIRNLTFKMTNLEHLASSTEGGYAAHIDARTKDDAGYNMLIQDCDFESATGPAVGIGTHMNGNLVFIGCKFISTADPAYNPIEGYTNIANWGVVFAHASTYENMTNQKLKFENCNGVHTLGNRSLSITGSGDLTVTLLRNIFYSIAQGAPAYNLSQTILYDVLNYGNNIPT